MAKKAKSKKPIQKPKPIKSERWLQFAACDQFKIKRKTLFRFSL